MKFFTTIHPLAKKIVPIFIFTGIIFLPHKAHAIPTVEAPGPALTAIVSTAAHSGATAVSTAAIALHTTQINTGTGPKNIGDALVYALEKTVVQSITRSTVNWINSGFNGSPAFVSDLTTNLSNLSDEVANDFFKSLTSSGSSTTGAIGSSTSSVKSPFQDQISAQLRAEYYKTTGSPVGSGYNLGTQSANPSAFLSGNFSQGGFNAFFSASQNPSNNPFGAYNQASNALYASINAATQKRLSELNWGKGFLPWRGACNPAGGSTSSATAKDPGYGSIGTSTPTELLGANGATTQTPPANLSTAEQCTSNPVKTPGSVIEGQLENVLGSGVRELDLADSINEIVGALLGQLVNQVLGPGGLLGTSQPSAGGGPSYLNQATNGSSYASTSSSLSQGVLQNTQTDQAGITSYRDGWQTILTAANAAQQTCGVRSELTPIITTATANVARGNTALSLLQKVQAEIQAAATNTSVTQTTAITTALTDYQSFLASPIVPSGIEQSDAVIQSTDTTGDASSTPSLLTQVQTLQKTCVATPTTI